MLSDTRLAEALAEVNHVSPLYYNILAENCCQKAGTFSLQVLREKDLNFLQENTQRNRLVTKNPGLTSML